ncbi:MAG: GDSL-type esterase/lipase family protein [Polyangiaceae bacterium]
MIFRQRPFYLTACMLATAGACSPATSEHSVGSGGATATAGASASGDGGATVSGGANSGGANSGGAAPGGGMTGVGGTAAAGGTSSGGTASGGTADPAGGKATNGGATNGGGASSGGASSGGASVGGATRGGTSQGGTSAAGSTNGGTTNSGGARAGGATGGGGVAQGGSTSAGGSAGSGSVFPSGVTKPKIMIVGDSISAGPGCYKKYLLQNLKDSGRTSYEFVGEYTDDCGGGVRHSAVSCSTSAQFTQPTFTVPNCNTTVWAGMATLVQKHNPDLIMLQLGVNDVWSGNAPVDPILANYKTLIQQARAQNANVVVVVAQIHKIITNNCQNAASTSNAQQLVNAIPAWVQTVNTAQSRVLVADLWTNSDAHEADDCVHPNDAGAKRMGLNWFNALKDILK